MLLTGYNKIGAKGILALTLLAFLSTVLLPAHFHHYAHPDAGHSHDAFGDVQVDATPAHAHASPLHLDADPAAASHETASVEMVTDSFRQMPLLFSLTPLWALLFWLLLPVMRGRVPRVLRRIFSLRRLLYFHTPPLRAPPLPI